MKFRALWTISGLVAVTASFGAAGPARAAGPLTTAPCAAHVMPWEVSFGGARFRRA